MRKHFAVLALLALPMPALADATVTFSVEGKTVGSVTVTKTLSDADAGRLLNWAIKAYRGPIDSGTQDGNGNPILRDRTPAEAVAAMIDGTFAGYAANVVNAEQDIAKAAAAASVQPLVPK